MIRNDGFFRFTRRFGGENLQCNVAGLLIISSHPDRREATMAELVHDLVPSVLESVPDHGRVVAAGHVLLQLLDTLIFWSINVEVNIQ